ncbi:unnamed protein product [Closterium sp. Naga37s-1]|nr:unnamed protein product [Closterium sp. Naga37s-1]
MEVARTSMCHAGAPQFLWPQAVRYAAHQLNLWPSDARPRVTPIFLWTGFPGVAADYRVWGCVSHVTPQSSPPQRPVSVMSGGAGGAAVGGEGTGAAGAGGSGSGGAGGVDGEVPPVEDTAASSRQPRPASPPGFRYSHSSLPARLRSRSLRSLGVFLLEVLEALGVLSVEVLVLGVLELEALPPWRKHSALSIS